MGDSVEVMVVVVSQEGLLKAVPFDEMRTLLEQGYRIATPAQCDQFYQEQRAKSDLRE